MAPMALILAIVCVNTADLGNSREVVAAIRVAYEANRAALAPAGTIVFACTDGVVGPSPSLEAFDADLRGRWERRSPSVGIYVFDGSYRRYDNLYSLEDPVARRMKISKTTWSSVICGVRLLTDGETTLVDNVGATSDSKSINHAGNLRAGSAEFFRSAIGIPLSLGDPDPLDRDLGRCLEILLAGRDGVNLVALDEKARLDDRDVVKLEVDFPKAPLKRRITYWIDMERGAIPLQMRLLAPDPQSGDTVMFQINDDDLRFIDRGWLPFRSTLTEGDLTKSGGVLTMFTREIVVESANFTVRPARQLFSLIFPEDQGLSDSDRVLGFGVRRVWDVSHFSRAARARARPLRGGSKDSGPIMPPVPSASGWGVMMLTIFGIMLLLISAAIAIRRLYHARLSV